MLIQLKSKILQDEYTNFVHETYDIANKEETIVSIENNIKIDEFEWNIGVIYGGSGSGKSTLLRAFGEIKSPVFDNSKSLISNFNWLTPDQASQLLSSMGLASIPCWLRPHSSLSNGEQYRANLAYCVAQAKENEIVLIDEYTSVVDRDVAKAMSNALQKYIRKHNKKIILASCHFDIMDWLVPDWIYSPNKRRVERRECLRLERPKIELEICRCRYETWDIFKQYHYLTSDLNQSAKCFLASWNDKPLGFFAVLPFPHGSIKNAFRASRLVILPDYQGLGIGSKIMEYFASLYAANDSVLYVKSSNPALLGYMKNSKDKWEFCGETSRKELNTLSIEKNKKANFSGFRNAVTQSYKWKGYKSKDSVDIINFSSKAYDKSSQLQISLF